MGARRAKKTRRQPAFTLEEHEEKGDFQALLEHLRENPLLYAAATAFILVCALAGVVYRANEVGRERAVASQYAQALETMDASLRAAELEQLVDSAGELSAEILFMMGSAAAEAGDTAKARDAFERVRSEHPESPFTPDAVEGLGFIAENKENYQGAVALYREILEKWPGSFTALRQPFNIARCEERQGNIPGAIGSYQEQLALFQGSNVAAEAFAALGRLQRQHPDLFAQPEPPQDFDAILDALDIPAAPAEGESGETVSQEDTTPAEPAAETSPTEESSQMPPDEPAP